MPFDPRSRTKKQPVPKSLARTVAHEVSAKQQRLAVEARADIRLIKRRRQRITEDFYDIGDALIRLKRPGVAAALKYKNFGELCQAELQMSPAKAESLIDIVRRVTRDDAVSLGQERAAALLALADATPEADTPHDLQRAVLRLPSGKKLDVAKASANEIKQAAIEVRAAVDAKKPKRGRGRTSTPEERAIAARLEKRIQKAGIPTATVRALATQPGRGGKLRIDGIPVADVAKLGGLFA